MSDADNRHPYQPHPDQGWQPLPQGGEYESEATAFVQLPEGFTTGVYGGGSPRYNTPGPEPLAAPGHGYTPPASFSSHTAPQVADAGTDPSSTGQWTMPFADPSAGYADPTAGYPAHTEHAPHHDPSAGYQGGAPEAAQPWGGDTVEWPVAGSPEAGGTGAWSVPAAADDGLEESGEYLVGDDGLTGHTGLTGGHPGLPGHSGHPGHPGHGVAAGYHGGGYPGSGAYGDAGSAADTGEAAGTGHWNFTAGLSATSAPETHHAEPQETGHGGAVHDPFGGPADDPYAHERGLPGHGTQPGGERPGDGGPSAGDPYATGAGGRNAAAGDATGHWSLPADALAQWPPVAETAQPSHDGSQHQQEAQHQRETQHQQEAQHQRETADRPGGAADAPDAGGWSIPVAEGEQQEHSGEFALADAAGHLAPAPPTVPEADGAADAPMETAESTETAGTAELGAPTESRESGEPVDLTGSADLVATTDEGTAPRDTADAAGSPGDAEHTGAGDPAAAEERTGAGERTGTGDPRGADADAGESTGLVDGLAAAHPSDLAADPGFDDHDEHPAASYVLRVNGIDRPVTDAWIGESLLYVLRERLGLAGAKDGCSQGECGACSVQVDGRLVASCLVPAATTAGSEVRTVEGLAENGVPSDVQCALAASGAVQCGFCVPGMAMTVHDLLEGNHAPSELETRKALCGNLCRCSGYRGVLDAVDEVVKARAEAAGAAYAPADEPDGAAPADTARIPHQAGPADETGHAPHDQDPHPGGSA
ncbi:2Fe-2S iron-sulfur cluster-binding protein [Streptomyces nigrescens]|uniref:2Fe-2S iron-sulfur cluster-binding protein n=1 Tax=Streptomyces nigrescens TaxID=1920 RepID=UPI002253B7B9|nr:2Fe-2S iron-sulfur cluster-binding protein [Streptomyces libani]MCX5450869.1 2Fe-2S iron-sulfur cluster-binding protein [Streptomyces libani]